jgi:hypothetical protein
MKGPMDLQERFLGRIFSILRVPQQPVAVGIDTMFVPMEQVREPALFIDLDAFYQLFVRESLHAARFSVVSV